MNIKGEYFYVHSFLGATHLEYKQGDSLVRANGTPYCSIVFVTNGSIIYNINGIHYSLKKGNLMFIPSNVPYQRTVEDANGFSFILLSFDIHNINPKNFPISTVIDVTSYYEIIKDIHHIYNICQLKDSLYCIRSLSIMQELLLKLINIEFQLNYGEITQAIIYIRENFVQDIKNNQLATMSNMSYSHFMKVFKKNIGISPTAYRNNLRFNYAKDLLLSQYSVTKVAQMTGFSSASYFCRQFLAKEGISPKEYSRKYEKV